MPETAKLYYVVVGEGGKWELEDSTGRNRVKPKRVPGEIRNLQKDEGVLEFDVEVDRDGGTAVIRSVGMEAEQVRTALVHDVDVETVFRNPYNFVPFDKDRAGFEGPLADSPPVGHATYHAEAWSGTITVRGVVRTPLILTPAPPATPAGQGDQTHRTYGCRVGADGLPWLPPTSLRGAIRNRYEALTDSRFGVVSEVLDRRFAFRQGTEDAQRAVPVRVSSVDDHLTLVPLLGTSSAYRDDHEPLWAAWLPMNCGEADALDHGTFVYARLRRTLHVNRRGGARYPIWYVERAVPAGQRLPDDSWQPYGNTAGSVNRYEDIGDIRLVHGWVFRTSPAPNVPSTGDRKFERLFFVDNTAEPGLDEQRVIKLAARQAGALTVLLDARLQEGFEAVIAAYDAAEADRAQVNNPPNGSAHLPEHGSAAHRTIHDGLLCFGILNSGATSISHLSPVTIGREPYACTARDLLPESVGLAQAWSELSPADRVFGWVHQQAGEEDGRVALRSSVRLTPCAFEPPEEGEAPLIETTDRRLAILSAPKPSYGRFYLTSAARTPRKGGHKREVGYQPDNHLRGRKVYPHQPGAETPGWFDAGGGRPWESQEPPSNQNRTVSACVRSGAVFSFDIHVRNLTSAELGALIEVIDRASGQGRIRLGYGRPLGFGSVELERTQVCVETGRQRRDRLVRFDTSPVSPCSDEVIDDLRESFLQAFSQAHGESLAEHPIGRATMAEARGFDDGIVVAYPGVAEGRASYEWFMDNEASQRRERSGAQEPLGLLDQHVPYYNRRDV